MKVRCLLVLTCLFGAVWLSAEAVFASSVEAPKKSLEELEAINSEPLAQGKSVIKQVSERRTESSGSTIQRPATIKPDAVHFAPQGKTLPNKSIRLQCRVMSQELLPEEKVTITKEINDNIVVQEDTMVPVDTKPGERIYEYVVDMLPVGDYKFKCYVNYVSNDYKRVSTEYDKNEISINEMQSGQYSIIISRPIYVLVRDDEVLTAGWNFENMEKDQLIRRIHKKYKDPKKYYYPDLLKKSIEELEDIYGEPLPKYKAIGVTRPK